MRDFLGIGNRGRRTLGEKSGRIGVCRRRCQSGYARFTETDSAGPSEADNGSQQKVLQPAPDHPPGGAYTRVHAYKFMEVFSWWGHAVPPYPHRGVHMQPSCISSEPSGKVKEECVRCGGMCSETGGLAHALVSFPRGGGICMYPCTLFDLQTDIQTQIYR